MTKAKTPKRGAKVSAKAKTTPQTGASNKSTTTKARSSSVGQSDKSAKSKSAIATKKVAAQPSKKKTSQTVSKSMKAASGQSKVTAKAGTKATGATRSKFSSEATSKSAPNPAKKRATVARNATKSKSTSKVAVGKMASASRSKKARKAEIKLPDGYRPKDNEPFMGDLQQVYFRDKLLAWKEDIVRQTRETIAGLNTASEQHADVADRATSETDRALELRARDRQRKLVAKINAALARIEDGSYGYCDETGEPIGLKRLEARPIATLSLEAQERHERRERVFRED